MKIEKGWTVELNGIRYIVVKGGSNKIKILLDDNLSIPKPNPINIEANKVKIISRNKIGILGTY